MGTDCGHLRKTVFLYAPKFDAVSLYLLSSWMNLFIARSHALEIFTKPESLAA